MVDRARDRILVGAVEGMADGFKFIKVGEEGK